MVFHTTMTVLFKNDNYFAVLQERNGLSKGYDSLKLELNEAKVNV